MIANITRMMTKREIVEEFGDILPPEKLKALGVENSMIGIENNKSDAIDHLTKLATGFKGIKVFSLNVKYPQGAEKQLIKALINKEVPSGRLPLDVGTVVHNVGTAFAVYEAVQFNKPLIERVVTVTGKDINNFADRLKNTVLNYKGK